MVRVQFLYIYIGSVSYTHLGDAHHLHVFNGYFSHELIRQTWFVLWFEAQSYVPYRLLTVSYTHLHWYARQNHQTF